MKIDWMAKLRHMLQVLAFALAIATIQYAFLPDRPYGPPLVYSLFIATITWAMIDLGREFFPSSLETGWPKVWAALALVLGAGADAVSLTAALAELAFFFLGASSSSSSLLDDFSSSLEPQAVALAPRAKIRTRSLSLDIAFLRGQRISALELDGNSGNCGGSVDTKTWCLSVETE